MNRPQRPNNNATRLFYLLAVLLSVALPVCAQSLDQNAPAPVRSNTVTGRIAARDLGDARLTDHFYALTGTPGDLLITITSQNLNGDVDVFTAGTLRPLLHLTLYAEVSSPVTKSIYLRKREDLVLRVEARSPNDNEGTYRLFFGGSFEPIAGGPEISENEATEPSTTEVPGARKGRRVNSAGARIAEPEPPVTETAAAPTPEPSPETKPIESPTPLEKPAETAESAKPSPPARTPRRKAPPRRVGTTARAPKETTRQPAETTRTTETPRTTEPATTSVEQPKPEPEPEAGPRLVIETNDGTLINRPMSGVRRVTVENGQVVVVGKNGKIDRFLLANVVRMAIAP
ncbi:MAG TPA: hypothetical protein VGK82_02405 [Pyrinomonadaceae bacterium]